MGETYSYCKICYAQKVLSSDVFWTSICDYCYEESVHNLNYEYLEIQDVGINEVINKYGKCMERCKICGRVSITQESGRKYCDICISSTKKNI